MKNRRPNFVFLCEMCGGERKKYVAPKDPRPRFCSVQCRGAASAKSHLNTKERLATRAALKIGRHANYCFRCEECGVAKEIYLRPSYEEPQYCSNECKLINNPVVLGKVPMPRGESHYAWKKGEIGGALGRSRAKSAIPNPTACERCGSEFRLERHHKDRDPGNNTLRNLEVLCKNCHLLEHSKEVWVLNGNLWGFRVSLNTRRQIDQLAKARGLNTRELIESLIEKELENNAR